MAHFKWEMLKKYKIKIWFSIPPWIGKCYHIHIEEAILRAGGGGAHDRNKTICHQQ